ncbi:MAG: hypothetical protein GVY32_06800 [Gammaproteobacteria bacterium]|jgi:hypothetical protein|nr:hypothetical protein [Gammaproteobacteria bacterium]
MKTLRIITLAALLTGCLATAWAQDHSRTTEPGAVLALTEVHVKPGMWNAYMNDLKANWRRSMEAQMEDGHVLGYGMYAVVSPREGEPNLILRVTYPNWAAFDRGPEYFEELMESTFGGMDEAREAGIERGELRTLGSELLLREVKFMD